MQRHIVTDSNVYSDGDLKTGSEPKSGSNDFGLLYETHLTGIYRFVYYRVGEKALAEDLTSDIFTRALAAFGRFDSRKASFPTWLYTIARNTLTDYFRKPAKEKKLDETEESYIPSAAAPIEEELAREEEFQVLHRCLRKLRTREQEIISLKFSSGLTNRDIAAITGLSETNVGTILCRTIRKLRDDFTGAYNNG